jgi:hypothetical protein
VDTTITAGNWYQLARVELAGGHDVGGGLATQGGGEVVHVDPPIARAQHQQLVLCAQTNQRVRVRWCVRVRRCVCGVCVCGVPPAAGRVTLPLMKMARLSSGSASFRVHPSRASTFNKIIARAPLVSTRHAARGTCNHTRRQQHHTRGGLASMSSSRTLPLPAFLHTAVSVVSCRVSCVCACVCVVSCVVW